MNTHAAPRQALGVLVQRVLGVLVLLTVAGIVFTPRMPVADYQPVLLGLGLVAVATGWWFLTPRVGAWAARRRLTTRGWDVLAVVLSLAGVALAALVAYGCAYLTTWDVQIVRTLAAKPVETFTAADQTYLQRYPHNYGLMAIGRLAWSLGWGYETLFGIVNVAILAIGAGALYVTVRLLRSPAAGVGSLLVFWILLGTTPWLAVPYTDTLVIASPIVSVACFVIAMRRRRGARWAWLAASAVALGAVHAFKPTVVVGIAALVLTLLLHARRERVREAVIGSVVVVLAFLASSQAVGLGVHAAADLPPLDEDKAAPTLLFIAMGNRLQNADKGGARYWYGGFDRELETATVDQPSKEQKRIAREAIAEQWDERGAWGTLGFSVSKTLATWGDGMFFERAEGYDLDQPQLHDDLVAKVVGVWNVPSGSLYDLRVLLAQIAWVSLLMGLGVGLLRARARPETVLMSLTVLGIAAFVVVFLSRSRHLLPYVPVLIALAACVVPWRSTPPPADHATRIGQ